MKIQSSVVESYTLELSRDQVDTILKALEKLSNEPVSGYSKMAGIMAKKLRVSIQMVNT